MERLLAGLAFLAGQAASIANYCVVAKRFFCVRKLPIRNNSGRSNRPASWRISAPDRVDAQLSTSVPRLV